jgi:hypothetical protein
VVREVLAQQQEGKPSGLDATAEFRALVAQSGHMAQALERATEDAEKLQAQIDQMTDEKDLAEIAAAALMMLEDE